MVPGSEIQAYTKRTTAKYGLDKFVSLNSTVLETIWSDDLGKWEIVVEKYGSRVRDEADVLINCTGWLNMWKWPRVDGLHDFKGKLVHTARWCDEANEAARE